MAQKFSFIFAYGLVYMTRFSLGYEFVCPDVSQWRSRARTVCTSDYSLYHCLYDTNRQVFIEKCIPPVEYTTGRKAILSGNLNAQICGHTRYMPFIFVSNICADCVYQKSFCSEEGQMVHHIGSSAEDAACMCDYTAGYAFVVNPKNRCYCVPSEEDCSCYRKSCLHEYQLSADFSCILKTESLDGGVCQVMVIRNRHSAIGSGLMSKSDTIKDDNIKLLIIPDLHAWPALVVTITLASLVMPILLLVVVTDDKVSGGNITLSTLEKTNDITEIGDVVSVGIESAVRECWFKGEILGQFHKRQRILDMCFVNINKKLHLLYIDADNDCIVTRPVSEDDTVPKIIRLQNNPNRLSKIDDRKIAIIYKRAFKILIFNVQKMEPEVTYDVEAKSFLIESHKYGIQGIVALNETEFILSNQHKLYQCKCNDINTEQKVNYFAEDENFDTARRLAVSPDKKIVFVADEDEKQITSISQKDKEWIIHKQRHHNRGLQNVRAIVATKNKVYAATSAGVAVYSHKNGTFGNFGKKSSYEMLIEYVLNVEHTRSLCLENNGHKIFLGISFVYKGEDVVAVFSFPSNNDLY